MPNQVFEPLDITEALSKHPIESTSLNSLSTHLAQLVIFLATKSRKIVTTSWDPCLIWRSNISFRSRTYAELVNPSLPKKTQVWREGRSAPWATWGNKRLEVYQGSQRGKAGRSKISSGPESAEEPSPSKGVGEHSFLFLADDEAMEVFSFLEQGREEGRRKHRKRRKEKRKKKGERHYQVK